ncbi:MAG: DUF4114 domain-containing protein [Rivularia sp. (in: Bacteria)]|nr:DUF4114 domain-containing protein [Rivularia sp. MS3]
MAIITVSNSADSGKGTLREAILEANSGDTIRFDSALANKKIRLTKGQLEINKDLIIDGADAENLTISGNKSSRVFFVDRAKDLTLKNLTVADARAVSGKIRKNNATESGGGGVYVDFFGSLTLENTEFKDNVADMGGGIYVQYGGQATILNSSFDNNDGTPANNGFSGGAISSAGQTKGMTVKNSRFSNNKGSQGGAIYSLLSPLTVENSIFVDNVSTREGGAIFTDGASPRGKENRNGTISISNSKFVGNQSVGGSGGLYLYTYEQEKAIVEDSTITNNSVTEDGIGNSLGGGIRTGGGSSKGNLIIRNTTIANNSSNTGGGLWHDGSKSITIENSTLSGNKASSGGAIFSNSKGPINIISSTIAENTSRGKAGAIWSSGKNEITLSNSIVANNTSKDGKQTSFELKDGGGNIEFSDPPSKQRVTANSQIVDPKLDSLQTIDGSLIHPLKSDSPAIDAGTARAVDTDQRGVSRDSNPDIGAFEFVSNSATPKPSTPIKSNPIRYEAEELNLNGYRVEIVENSSASNNQHISLKGTKGNQGSATGKFDGEAGTYQVKVGYYDENDGQSKAEITVGEEIASFVFDQDLPDNWAKPAAKTSRIVIEEVELTSGDSFKIEASSDEGEFARFDYIEFSPIADASIPTPQSAIQPEPVGGEENTQTDVEDRFINGIVNLSNIDFNGDGKTDERVSLVLDDINTKAAYSNSGGFYQVLDVNGTVLDTVTNQQIRPGEQGYETAALNQSITQLTFDASDSSLTAQVDGGIFLAPYLIANGTVEEFIGKNPNNNRQENGLNAYFAFGNANPDKLEHLQSANNKFGFEDFYGGGDRDFSDFNFSVNIESA